MRTRLPLSEPARWTLVAGLLLLALSPHVTANDDTQSEQASSIDRKPLQTVVPVYPEKARRDRIEGEVQVCFEIARDGHTRRIAVRKSTHRVFEKPSIRAVRASTYEALPEGVELPVIKACRTFRFTLQLEVREAED